MSVKKEIVEPTDPVELRGYRQAMRDRCEIQGYHDFESACTIFLQIYMVCRWCGEEKHLR